MKWIAQIAPWILFGLLVVLSFAVAATALPWLVIPLLSALAALIAAAVIIRLGR